MDSKASSSKVLDQVLYKNTQTLIALAFIRFKPGPSGVLQYRFHWRPIPDRGSAVSDGLQSTTEPILTEEQGGDSPRAQGIVYEKVGDFLTGVKAHLEEKAPSTIEVHTLDWTTAIQGSKFIITTLGLSPPHLQDISQAHGPLKRATNKHLDFMRINYRHHLSYTKDSHLSTLVPHHQRCSELKIPMLAVEIFVDDLRRHELNSSKDAHLFHKGRLFSMEPADLLSNKLEEDAVNWPADKRLPLDLLNNPDFSQFGEPIPFNPSKCGTVDQPIRNEFCTSLTNRDTFDILKGSKAFTLAPNVGPSATTFLQKTLEIDSTFEVIQIRDRAGNGARYYNPYIFVDGSPALSTASAVHTLSSAPNFAGSGPDDLSGPLAGLHIASPDGTPSNRLEEATVTAAQATPPAMSRSPYSTNPSSTRQTTSPSAIATPALSRESHLEASLSYPMRQPVPLPNLSGRRGVEPGVAQHLEIPDDKLTEESIWPFYIAFVVRNLIKSLGQVQKKQVLSASSAAKEAIVNQLITASFSGPRGDMQVNNPGRKGKQLASIYRVFHDQKGSQDDGYVYVFTDNPKQAKLEDKHTYFRRPDAMVELTNHLAILTVECHSDRKNQWDWISLLICGRRLVREGIVILLDCWRRGIPGVERSELDKVKHFVHFAAFVQKNLDVDVVILWKEFKDDDLPVKRAVKKFKIATDPVQLIQLTKFLWDIQNWMQHSTLGRLLRHCDSKALKLLKRLRKDLDKQYDQWHPDAPKPKPWTAFNKEVNDRLTVDAWRKTQ